MFGGGVAVDMDFEWPDAFPLRRASQELFTRRAGVRVRQHQFVKQADVFALVGNNGLFRSTSKVG